MQTNSVHYIEPFISRTQCKSGDWFNSDSSLNTVTTSIDNEEVSIFSGRTITCKLRSNSAIKSQTMSTNTLGLIFIMPESLIFSSFVDQWYEERGITSSLHEIVNCPSYIKIIGMGKTALPLILSKLIQEGNEPDHWFVALEAITNEDIVPEDSYGDMKKMAKLWLSWADENNVW